MLKAQKVMKQPLTYCDQNLNGLKPDSNSVRSAGHKIPILQFTIIIAIMAPLP